MLHRLTRTALAFAVAATIAAGPLARPAAASVGSTWTTIEAAAALIGGIVLYNNYQHKRQAATRVVGYTRNGGTVYGDGRIVMPDGTTIYPGRNGRYSWGQSAYYVPGATGYSYGPDERGEGSYRRANYYNGNYRDRDDRGRGHHKHHEGNEHGDH